MFKKFGRFFAQYLIEMLGTEKRYISFEKWNEMMSKNTFIFEEEKPKLFDKLFEMYGDDLEEEDEKGKKYKKEENRKIYF